MLFFCCFPSQAKTRPPTNSSYRGARIQEIERQTGVTWRQVVWAKIAGRGGMMMMMMMMMMTTMIIFLIYTVLMRFGDVGDGNAMLVMMMMMRRRRLLQHTLLPGRHTF